MPHTWLVVLLAAAPAVRQGGAPLRVSGCGEQDAVVGQLPAGEQVEIRFALAGSAEACYKVRAAGKEGYLAGAAITGVEEFERGRREAPAMAAPAAAPPVAPPPGRKAVREEPAGLSRLGYRVELKYAPGLLEPPAAAGLVAVLDEEIRRLSAYLPCGPHERMTAVALAREAWLKAVDATEWAPEEHNGRIRVPADGALPASSAAIAHEVVHACLASSGRWPAWLHEGLAQRLSGETLAPEVRSQLRSALAAGNIPRLDRITQPWFRLGPRYAVVANGLALEAVEMAEQQYGASGLAALVRSPQTVAQFSAALDARLKR